MDTFTSTTPFALSGGYNPNETTYESEAELNRQASNRSDFVLTGIQPKDTKAAITLVKHKRRVNYNDPQAAVGASSQDRIFGHDEKSNGADDAKQPPKDKENKDDCDGAPVVRLAAGVPPVIRAPGTNPFFGGPPPAREMRPQARNPITGEFDVEVVQSSNNGGRYQGNRRNQSSFNNFGTNH
jgi:hypothetical protein